MDKKKLNIYMDFDDVTVQSKRRIVEMINEDYNTNYSHLDIKTWSFKEIKEVPKSTINGYFSSKRFFEGVKFYKGAKEGLLFLSNYFNIIITSAGSESNLLHKEEFCKLHFPNIEFKGVLMTPESNFHAGKSFIKDGIIVDDNKHNLDNCEANCKINFIPYGIKSDYSWNDVDISRMTNSDDETYLFICDEWLSLMNILSYYEGVDEEED